MKRRFALWVALAGMIACSSKPAANRGSIETTPPGSSEAAPLGAPVAAPATTPEAAPVAARPGDAMPGTPTVAQDPPCPKAGELEHDVRQDPRRYAREDRIITEVKCAGRFATAVTDDPPGLDEAQRAGAAQVVLEFKDGRWQMVNFGSSDTCVGKVPEELQKQLDCW